MRYLMVCTREKETKLSGSKLDLCTQGSGFKSYTRFFCRIFFFFLYCSFHISLSKTFWRLLFYFYLFLAETFIICVNVFYIIRNEISVGSDKKRKFSLQTPIIKIAHFFNVMSIDMTLQKGAIFRHVYRHDVTKGGDFYNGGLWGKSLSCVGSS